MAEIRMTKKQVEKLSEDIRTARLYLVILLADKDTRKKVAEKTGMSYNYLHDFVNARKNMSDEQILKILRQVVE